MWVRDEDGSRVHLVSNSEPVDVFDFRGTGLRLTLRHPIFFCRRARLATRQSKAQPVILASRANHPPLAHGTMCAAPPADDTPPL